MGQRENVQIESSFVDEGAMVDAAAAIREVEIEAAEQDTGDMDEES